MTRAVAARHILQQIRLDPRLAYLIGPGSESFELLIKEAAQAQNIDIDVMRGMQTKGLQFQPWPSENAIQIRIDEAVQIALAAARKTTPQSAPITTQEPA